MENQQPTNIQNIKSRMWHVAIVHGVIWYFMSFLYLFFQSNYQVNSFILSSSFAGAAAIMIGYSFALSSVCFYFNLFDTKIAYRKYFGLVGFWLALAYSISLLFVQPDRYFFGFMNHLLTADFLLGLTSMAIFTFMALISNDTAIKWLGPHVWRIALRLGYVAWFLLVIRAYILEESVWKQWFMFMNELPPLRLILSILVIGVICLRISVEIVKILQVKNTSKANIGV